MCVASTSSEPMVLYPTNLPDFMALKLRLLRYCTVALVLMHSVLIVMMTSSLTIRPPLSNRP